MPRLPRIHIEGCLYYVTVAGNHNEALFKGEGDLNMYLELLKKYRQQHGFKLFSFVLRPQEINLLIELKGQATISMVMHDLSSSYTKYFNSHYNRKGHLFRERFKSVVVEKDKNLPSLISYMHLYPLQIELPGVCPEYVYTSNCLYLYNTAQSENKTAENIKKILQLKEEAAEAFEIIAKEYPDKKTYSDFVSAVTKEDLDNFKKKLHRAGILGSEEFIEKIKAQMQAKPETEIPVEEKFSLAPVVSVTIAVMIAGIGMGIFIIQKNSAPGSSASKRIDVFSDKTENKEGKAIKEEQAFLTELDGTEWTIEVKSKDKTVTPAVYFDKLEFKGHMLSSKEMAVKGFQSSNYTLTVQNDGTLLWETMQRNAAGEVVFWQGQTTKDNKMSGIMSKNSADGKSQDILFTSVGYWRKE